MKTPIGRAARLSLFVVILAGPGHVWAVGQKASGRRQSARPPAATETPLAAAGRLFAEAERLRKQGKAPAMSGAVEKYKAALPLWRAAADRRGEADTLRSMGEAYNFLGDNRQALECGRAALALYESLRERAGEARALYLLGEIYYWLADVETALAHHKRASDVWLLLGDKAGQSLAQVGVGYDHSIRGDVDKALTAFGLALDLAQSAGDRRGEALAACALATQYGMIGEGQRALGFYDRALRFFRADGDRFHEARTLNGLAYIYYQVGESRKALNLYEQTLQIYVSLGHRQGESAVRILTGRIYDEAGRTREALEQYRRALSISRALSNRLMQSYALGYIGKAFDSLGDSGQALLNYRSALELNRLGGDRREEAYTLANIGRVLLGRGDYADALEHYGRALALSRGVGDLRAAALALYDIARAERGRGDLEAARARVEEAIRLSDAFRAKVAGQEMRASYSATVHQQYEFYVDVLMRLHGRRPSEKFEAAAFEASERGRALSLLETLAESRKDIRQGVDPELLKRERELQRLLSAKAERRIQLASAKARTEEVAAVEKELGELTAEFQRLEGQIRAVSPHYAALVQPVPLTLAELQRKVLDADTVLLEYALGEERSFVWAVTPDSIRSFELPARAEVEKVSRLVYELLTARVRRVEGETEPQWRARVRKAEAEYEDASVALGRMLLGPVAAGLEGKRLVVVADGALQYVPFAALPVETRGRAGRAPLIAEHEVVSLPSASVLALMREMLRGRAPAPRSVAVLADPVFDRDDERLAASKGVRARRRDAEADWAAAGQRALRSFDGLDEGGGIARLPFSQREAKAIAESAGDGMLALGFRASRATALSPELAQYRYVHFATHGLLNGEHPELSGILLSLFDEAGRRQDGFLELHEIYNLNLPAELVVLSACQTALGKDVKGEGLVGLTRGFMYAGARRVVSSLWKVDDSATAELMGEFYREMLGKGLRPAEALRAAQLRLRSQPRWRSPYYWAAFTLQGEWR
ncbi:MAG TPA: CHAT domain-containing protein [Pyrinomonadaceae bacterium]|nr:CHAT domain-containing protein [Pyrinomonadaceae bacterium]